MSAKSNKSGSSIHTTLFTLPAFRIFLSRPVAVVEFGIVSSNKTPSPFLKGGDVTGHNKVIPSGVTKFLSGR